MFHNLSPYNNKHKLQNYHEISEATKCPIDSASHHLFLKEKISRDSEKRQHMYPCAYKGDEELLFRKERYEP